MSDKEFRRRNWEAKRLYEERRFKQKVESPKPIKAKAKRPNRKELLNYAYDPDLPSDVDSWD